MRIKRKLHVEDILEIKHQISGLEMELQHLRELVTAKKFDATEASNSLALIWNRTDMLVKVSLPAVKSVGKEMD